MAEKASEAEKKLSEAAKKLREEAGETARELAKVADRQLEEIDEVAGELDKALDKGIEGADTAEKLERIPKLIEAAVAAIFAGGRDNVQGLIEMLGEPGSEENVKPHYALHCVVNHSLIVDDEKPARDRLRQILEDDAAPIRSLVVGIVDSSQPG